MAKLNIIKGSDPTLRKTSRPVSEITPRILTLLDDMTDTMRAADGCGLAAVQVGILRRIVVVEAEIGQLYELINPKIISSEGTQNAVEGCLSIPEKWGITERPMTVTVKATDRTGKEFTVTGSGLLARAFCHEIDHLDGKLFTDCSTKIMNAEELEEYLESDNLE